MDEIIFAKNRPDARGKEIRLPARSTTMRPRAFFPSVARQGELSSEAKYTQLPIKNRSIKAVTCGLVLVNINQGSSAGMPPGLPIKGLRRMFPRTAPSRTLSIR